MARPALYRSFLFLKNGLDGVGKATTRPDWFVVDFEDGCPRPTDKQRLREATCALLGAVGAALAAEGTSLCMRVNALEDMDHVRSDVGVITSAVKALMLPKVRSPSCIASFDALVSEVEESKGLPIGSTAFVPILETPDAMFSALAIATSSKRICALAFGHGDFVAAMRGKESHDCIAPARHTVAMAARAAGVEPLDSPCLKLNDPDLLASECASGRRIGYSGKMALHPRQVLPINRAFSPSDEEVAWATKVHAAGVKGLGDNYVSVPHVAEARRVLDFAVLVKARESGRSQGA